MMAPIAVTLAFTASDCAASCTSAFAGIFTVIGRFTDTPPFWVPASSTARNVHARSSHSCCVADSTVVQKWFPVDPLEACQWLMYPVIPAGTVYTACLEELSPADMSEYVTDHARFVSDTVQSATTLLHTSHAWSLLIRRTSVAAMLTGVVPLSVTISSCGR